MKLGPLSRERAFASTLPAQALFPSKETTRLEVVFDWHYCKPQSSLQADRPCRSHWEPGRYVQMVLAIWG